jgi:hypothetical protein
MRSWLLLLTLSFYGFDAMDLHEWVRVPQVILHILEHHSDLGHHDHADLGHQHEDIPAEDHDHSPFQEHGDALCAHASAAAELPSAQLAAIFPSSRTELIRGRVPEAHLASYSGSKWNPPKLG